MSQQTQADGTTYQFAYTLDGQGQVTQTDVTDPVRRVALNAAAYVTADTRSLGQPEQQTTTLEHQAGTKLVTATVSGVAPRSRTTPRAWS